MFRFSREESNYRNFTMRINLNQLYVFYLAAGYKNMAMAAKVLYVSPPAVTMQIKKMEHWLGFPVFERGRGKLRLTRRGQSLYDAIEPVFRNLDELERYIQDLVLAEEAELRFGTHHLPGKYFIPDLIAHVRAAYPGLKVRMELGTQDDLLQKLIRQKLDIALIIGGLPQDAKCKTMHLFDEELALVTAAKGEFGTIDSLSVMDLHTVPLILQQQGTGALRAVLDFLAKHQAQPTILLENLSSDVIKQFLTKMPAGAFIGRFIVQKELDEGIFHEIAVREGSPISRFHLAYMDNPYIPMKIKLFLDAVAGFSPQFRTLSPRRDSL